MSEPLRAQIDHVVIGVANGLDAAEARYRRLGFSLLERGHHSLGSSNHLAVFEHDYLELLGYEPARAAALGLDIAADPRWRHPAGLIGLVFKPGSEEALEAALQRRGIAGQTPRSFSRPLRLPDSSPATARFRTLHLPPETLPNGMVFFCQHETPEHVWRPEWQQHANRARGVAELVVAAADPLASVQPFAQLFGEQALVLVPGGLRLQAGRATLLFLSPAVIAKRYDGLAPGSIDGRDRLVALSLHSHDLVATRRHLQDAEISGVREHQGRLIVPPSQALGLALAFEDGAG